MLQSITELEHGVALNLGNKWKLYQLLDNIKPFDQTFSCQMVSQNKHTKSTARMRKVNVTWTITQHICKIKLLVQMHTTTSKTFLETEGNEICEKYKSQYILNLMKSTIISKLVLTNLH